jgi:ABC-2 type transport system ATP-binding protein
MKELALVGGTAEVGAIPVTRALSSGRVGVALLDPPLPPRWTFQRYLRESAALRYPRGLSPKKVASDLLAQYGLSVMANRRLDSLNQVERRTLSVVHATLGQPEVICCEAPLSRLDDVAQDYIEGLLERAFEGRRAVVSVLDPSGRERTVLDRTQVILRLGPDYSIVPVEPSALAHGRHVLVTVSRRGAQFVEALRDRGIVAQEIGPVEALSVVLGAEGSGQSRSFSVHLAEAGVTQSVFAAAVEAGAPLVELSPIV